MKYPDYHLTESHHGMSLLVGEVMVRNEVH